MFAIMLIASFSGLPSLQVLIAGCKNLSDHNWRWERPGKQANHYGEANYAL